MSRAFAGLSSNPLDKGTRSPDVRERGQAVLAYLERDEGDLVILDICLPGMSGLDLPADQTTSPGPARDRHDRPRHHRYGNRGDETGGV